MIVLVLGGNAYLHKGVSYIEILEFLQLALLEVHHIAIGGVIQRHPKYNIMELQYEAEIAIHHIYPLD